MSQVVACLMFIYGYCFYSIIRPFICFLVSVYGKRKDEHLPWTSKAWFSKFCAWHKLIFWYISFLWTIVSGASPCPVKKTKSKTKTTESEDEESWVVCGRTTSWVSQLLPTVAYLLYALWNLDGYPFFFFIHIVKVLHQVNFLIAFLSFVLFKIVS